MASTDWIHELKVVDLKEELKKRGLGVSGKKAELAERLEAYVKENEAEGGTSREPSPGEDDKSSDEEPDQEVKEGDAEEAAPAELAAEVGTEEQAATIDTTAVPAEGAPEEPAAEAEPAAESPEPAAPEVVQQRQESEQEQATPMEEEKATADQVQEQGEASGAAGAVAEAQEPASPAQEERQEEQQPSATAAEGPTDGVAVGQGEEGNHQEEEHEAAAMEEDRVELDYGESDHEEHHHVAGAAEQEKRGKAEAASARKRERDALGAAGEHGRDAAPSVERPSKAVRRDGSLGGAAGIQSAGGGPNPEDVPAAQEPATRALRIDNFVRPFTEGQVRSMLNAYGFVKAMWMPSIKTHCYAVFESKGQAEAARKGTWHVQWPATNPKRLAPRFVPLAEAEAAIGKGSGNTEFRIARTGEDEEAAATAGAANAKDQGASDALHAIDKRLVEKRRSREWNRERPTEDAPGADGLLQPAVTPDGVRDLREMLSSRRSFDRGGSRNVQDRIDSRRAEPPLVERGASPREPSPETEQALSLDELFRKTTTKPCVYWLPLTDEQVEEKKQAAAAATAAVAIAAAQQGEAAAPAAAVANAPNGAAAPTDRQR